MALELRGDFDAHMLRLAAKGSKNGPQARRLLALAAFYEGATHTRATEIGGVTRQIIRDWVVKFNELGPDGLIDRKQPGQPSRLNKTHREALAAIVESGPVLAIQVAPGTIAALLLDQAGWHMSSKLVVPANIVIIPLPPKCPELNPTENVWQFMRNNWLSNRVFRSYTDIVDHCCDAWNKLRDQPWRIMSIGLREWAHG